MATIAHCDTHVILWLYSGAADRFGKKAAEVIESHDLMVSPMVRLEVQFLYEIERIREKPDKIFKVLDTDFGITLCTDPFKPLAEAAEVLHWTRDPFDRIIVAQAMLHSVPLVTKDTEIRKHYRNAVW